MTRLSARYSAKGVLVNDHSEESAAGDWAGKERGSRMYEMQEPRPLVQRFADLLISQPSARFRTSPPPDNTRGRSGSPALPLSLRFPSGRSSVLRQ